MDVAQNLSTATKRASATPLVWVLRGFITLAVPVLMVTTSVRLVMTDAFLQFEYTRPGFPADYYGFTVQDRLTYAPFAITYLLNGADIDYLGDLRFPDGSAMYNARELHHMRDVKAVTQSAYIAGILIAILVCAAAWMLSRKTETHHQLRFGFMNGALLTFAIIAVIVILAITSWDFFFNTFHATFFADGTWRFEYSDTLIRLFPEQFWFDAALLIGGFTAGGAAIIMGLSWRTGASARNNNKH